MAKLVVFAWFFLWAMRNDAKPVLMLSKHGKDYGSWFGSFIMQNLAHRCHCSIQLSFFRMLNLGSGRIGKPEWQQSSKWLFVVFRASQHLPIYVVFRASQHFPIYVVPRASQHFPIFVVFRASQHFLIFVDSVEHIVPTNGYRWTVSVL